MSEKHVYGEAFKLMWYACKCGHREQIWNSRNGVTPFGIACPSCGKIANHADWKLDQHTPGHTLRDGQRFFRDGTPDEAVAIMKARIENMRADYPVSAEKEAAILHEAATMTEGEFQPGWPMLDIACRPSALLAASPEPTKE